MYKKINECKLSVGEKWCKTCLVTYPVSTTYNGGFTEYTYKRGKPTLMWLDKKREVVKSTHYEGFKVVKPKVPKGFTLYSIGCGFQLNAMPPYATSYLKPLDDKKYTRNEIKAILAKQ